MITLIIYVIFSYLFVHSAMHFTKSKGEEYTKKAIWCAIFSPFTFPIILSALLTKDDK